MSLSPYAEVNRLDSRTNESVERAVADPHALWSFLTDPSTPFADRAAAAYRGGRVFPYDQLPRLMRTLGELRAEERLHDWGLRPNPLANGARIPEYDAWRAEVLARLRDWSASERARTLLGHPWRVPTEIVAWHPAYWNADEYAAAPWPPQVLRVLEILLGSAAPRMGGENCPPEVVARCEEWLAEALTFTCANDDEALVFVEAAGACSHHVNERVLARYHTLLTDPRFARSAARIIVGLGEKSRLAMCAGPETVPEFQVLALDALTGPLPEDVRSKVAYEVARLRETWDGPKRPEPATLILLLSERGLAEPSRAKPDPSSDWKPFYIYLLSACEALDAPPFSADRRIDPAGTAPWIAKYRAWFEAQRPRLERAALQEKPALDAARARLLALESR